MNKTFNFGKIDYNNSGRKNCPVEVEIKLKTTKNDELEFTACGDIWNSKHTSVYSAGQNLDKIAEYIKNPTFLEIYAIWKRYHLNTMKAGTEKQEEALEAWREAQKAENKIILFDYRKDCEYLESVGLLFDEVNGKPYKYGSAWLTRRIPEEIVNKIKRLMEV